MGNYIVKADILEQMPEIDLIQLTDDDNTGLVDDGIVDGAIANAEGEVDGYLASRYTTPLSPVPDVIKAFTVDVAIYRIHGRRQGAPEHIEKSYENAIKFLKNASNGVVTLGVTTPAPENSGSVVDIQSDGRIFNRDDLDGF